MKKKRLIILLSIFVFLVLVVVLSSTVFTLKTVVVNFYDAEDKLVDDITKNHYFNSDEKINAIVENAEVKYGKNIFLVNQNSHREKIEKTNPYIKVVSISIEFPNRMVVKAVERQEYYAVLNKENKYFICDAEFKILRIADTKPTELVGVVAENKATLFDFVSTSAYLTAGDFIEFNEGTKNLFDFADEMYACHFEREKMLTLCKTITLENKPCSNIEKGKVNNIVIKTHAGVKIKIENMQGDFSNKILKVLEMYNSLVNGNNPENTTRGVIKVFDNLTCTYDAE